MKIERSVEQYFTCDGVGSAGFLVKKDLMKKIVKMQAKYLQEYKELLMENIDNIDVYHWGSARDKSGKHLYHHYIENSDNTTQNKIDRIKFMTTAMKPEKIDYVAIVDGGNRYEDGYFSKLRDETSKFFLENISGVIEDE